MRKAYHYFELSRSGLPVPFFGVFDSTCLTSESEYLRLTECVVEILSRRSGLVGVRTEPKGERSIFAGYPHLFPLDSLDAVVNAIEITGRKYPQCPWWFLVNEAFTSYKWNAVLRVTGQLMLSNGLRLDGEVNLNDNVPLRQAMGNVPHLLSAQKWYGAWPARLRKMIIRSGIWETWMEVSLVNLYERERVVFWGMR